MLWIGDFVEVNVPGLEGVLEAAVATGYGSIFVKDGDGFSAWEVFDFEIGCGEPWIVF